MSILEEILYHGHRTKSIVARSSTEYECRAMLNGAAEAIWFHALLSELGI